MAEGLFKQGKKLLAEGKVAEACEKLASSYHIDPAGGTLLNLGACHELEGKTATAWAELNDALAMANSAGRVERQKVARQHIAALEPRLSRVTVVAPPGGGDLEVKLDGVVLARGALGTGMPVDPGDHTATATAPGKLAWTQTVKVGPAESRTLRVPALEDVPAPPAAPPPAPVATWRKPAAIAALAAGGVGLVVGAAFGVRAVVLGGAVGNECHSGLCSPAGMSDVNDGRTAATLSNVLLPVGAVLAAAGGTLLAFPSLFSGTPPSTAEPQVHLMPVVGPGVALLQVGRAW